MSWTIDLMWWATAVEIPVLAGLVRAAWRIHEDAETGIGAVRRDLERGLSQNREALDAYKLDVAKTYVSIATLKDVEKRLTAHLDRIEYKLDAAQGVAGARP